ncbi:MAG TPA: hypothetical protein VF484_11025 [Candidatus Limnocylindrales bacterium]
MTTRRDLELVVSAWLDEGPTDLPPTTRRAILAAVPTIRRRRAGVLGLVGSGPAPSGRGWAELATAAVILAVALGLMLGVGLLGTVRPSPSPNPSAPPSASAPATPLPTGRAAGPTPFGSATLLSSAVNHFSLTVPAGWLVVPATLVWDGAGAPANDAPVADQLLPPTEQGRCQSVFVCAPTLWVVSAPTTGSLSAWVAARDAASAEDHPCPAIPESQRPIQVDGTPAVLETTHCPTAGGPLVLTAEVVRGGRGYVFALQDNAREAAVEALDAQEFVALLQTVRLSP